MTLAVLTQAEAAGRLQQSLGVAPGGDEGLCDLLRAEVHARGQTQRSITLDRVAHLLRGVIDVDIVRLAGACDVLVREGDLVLAPGGTLHATPLRAVPRPTGTRLFASLPTPSLAAVIGAPLTALGGTRSVATSDRLHAVVRALGGLVVAPDVWAGLDRAPLADAAFLAHLDERLTWEALPPGSLERDDALEWRGWVPAGDHAGWRRDAQNTRLWWARTAFRGHRRAWTSGGAPATHEFVELTFDEADRARFALSRDAGVGPPIVVERVDGRVLLDVPTWLPRPEYRWLSLLAEPAGDGVQTTRWRIDADHESTITARLAERLGLRVEVR